MKANPVMAYRAPKKRIDTTARRSEIKNPHLKSGKNQNIVDSGITKVLPWQSRIGLVDNDK